MSLLLTSVISFKKCLLPTQAQHIQGGEGQQVRGYRVISLQSRVASPLALGSCLIWPLLVRLWEVGQMLPAGWSPGESILKSLFVFLASTCWKLCNWSHS